MKDKNLTTNHFIEQIESGKITKADLEQLQDATAGVIQQSIQNLFGGLPSQSQIKELQTWAEILYSKYDSTQQGKKIKANACGYGILGTSSSRFYFIPSAEGTTTGGKALLLMVVKFITKKFGLKILYGDTDSLFIHLEPIIPEDIKNKHDLQGLRKFVYEWLEKELYPELRGFIDWYMEEYYGIPPSEHFFDFKTEIIIDKALFLKGKETSSTSKGETDEGSPTAGVALELQLLWSMAPVYFNQFLDKDAFQKLLNKDGFVSQANITKAIKPEIRKHLTDQLIKKALEYWNPADADRWLGIKKKYILHIVDKEKVAKDEFVYQGVELKRSELSPYVKDRLREIVEKDIFGVRGSPNLEQIQQKLNQLKGEIQQKIQNWDLEVGGIFKSISKDIAQYDTKVITVEGAKLYNRYARLLNLPLVESGTKIMLYYIIGINKLVLRAVLRDFEKSLRERKSPLEYKSIRQNFTERELITAGVLSPNTLEPNFDYIAETFIPNLKDLIKLVYNNNFTGISFPTDITLIPTLIKNTVQLDIAKQLNQIIDNTFQPIISSL
jgi:DNA polymerase elongation subunit (family B)